MNGSRPQSPPPDESQNGGPGGGHPRINLPAYTPPLAVLLVRNGALAGQRLLMHKPFASVGRARHNDLELADASVAETAALVVLREGVWMVTAMSSGGLSSVDGEAAKGDMPLAPGSTMVVGDVRLLFDPRDRPESRNGAGQSERVAGSGRRAVRRFASVLGKLAFAGALLLIEAAVTDR